MKRVNLVYDDRKELRFNWAYRENKGCNLNLYVAELNLSIKCSMFGLYKLQV